MWIIREFHQNIIEVSRVQIGKKLPKLWNLEVQFWSPILKAIGSTEKSDINVPPQIHRGIPL